MRFSQVYLDHRHNSSPPAQRQASAPCWNLLLFVATYSNAFPEHSDWSSCSFSTLRSFRSRSLQAIHFVRCSSTVSIPSISLVCSCRPGCGGRDVFHACSYECVELPLSSTKVRVPVHQSPRCLLDPVALDDAVAGSFAGRAYLYRVSQTLQTSVGTYLS